MYQKIHTKALGEVIGGEFDISVSEISCQVERFSNEKLYSSGRAALFHILQYLQGKGSHTRILLPDYLCRSITDVVDMFGFRSEYYSINEDLTIDLVSLKERYTSASIVLVINYFGLADCSRDITFIRTLDSAACIIEDNVQSFYSMSTTSEADFSFTSFRKSFPVPDGAWVVGRPQVLLEATDRNPFVEYKILGGVLKHLSKHEDVVDQIYLDYLQAGEQRIDEGYRSAMSGLSRCIMSGLDLESIAKARRNNAKYLTVGLNRMGIEPITKLSEEGVPLFLPVRLRDRDRVRAELGKERIFCPIHWPIAGNANLMRGKELEDSELSLVIDQRYSQADMDRILTVLEKAIGNGDRSS